MRPCCRSRIFGSTATCITSRRLLCRKAAISGRDLRKVRVLWWLELLLSARKCFLQICDLLAHPGREVSLLVSGRLKRALSVFEQAWVRYEESYVRDLIVIETFARRPLERAVHVELALLELEYPSDSRRKPPTPTQPTLIPKPVGLQPPQLTAPTERPSDSAHARDRTASAATEPSLPHRHRHPDLRAEDFSAFSHDSECECPRWVFPRGTSRSSG